MIIYHKSIFWVALSLSFKKLENQTIIDCRRLEVWSVDWNHLEPGAPAATSRRSQFGDWMVTGHRGEKITLKRALSDYPTCIVHPPSLGEGTPWVGIIWRWPSGRFRVEVGEETKFCCIQSSLVGEKTCFVCIQMVEASMRQSWKVDFTKFWDLATCLNHVAHFFFDVRFDTWRSMFEMWIESWWSYHLTADQRGSSPYEAHPPNFKQSPETMFFS